MTDIQQVIDYTNFKLQDWYKNVKIDYGVDGKGRCTYENNNVVINYTEDGVEKQWQYGFYSDERKEFYFNVWMEQS